MTLPLVIDEDTRVLVLTGAGVSAESGIPTYRAAPDALWENYRFQEVASPEGFAKDPASCWRFYGSRRAAAAEVKPNAGHYALAALEERLGDRFLLTTQNVDSLHTRAGSKRLIEMHGTLFKSRCTRCDRPAFEDHDTYAGTELPGCGRCAAKGEFALLRPHVVWFGEMLDPRDLEAIDAFMNKGPGAKLIFLAIGTSGAVYPAANLVHTARKKGAHTVLVNADRADNTETFHRFVQGASGRMLPQLFGQT